MQERLHGYTGHQQLHQQLKPLGSCCRHPNASQEIQFRHASIIGTFPAKYAAPPWDIWRIMGAPASRAASRVATTVEEEVTFCAESASTN
jgi:hypothetical protein